MKGAVIASTATPDKNKISTDTLTHSDIQNKADYSASSSGVSYSNKTGITPNPGIPVSGKADSTTKSAIADGTIEVRSGNTDLNNLNRDTNNALNSLGKIFDKKTVQEKQELANVFSQEANKAIGDLAESMRNKASTPEEKAKWAEGGEYKALLHAVVSGITTSMAGDGFASGTVGDGLSQFAQKELGKITNLNLRLIASAAVGAVAAKIVGGNAQAGASVAYNGVKYNDYGHRPTRPGSLIYSNGDANGVGRGFYKVGSDGNEYYQSNGINVGDVFWETTGTYDEDGIEIGKESILAADGTHIYFNWKEVDGVNVAVYDDTKAQVIVNGKSIIKAEDLDNHWYKSWLVQTETNNALYWAKAFLQLNGIDPDDPANGHELSDEVERQKQSQKDSMDMVMGSAGNGLKSLYGFKVGVTADEIRAINSKFGGAIELNGNIESALENAARYDGFWEKTAAITRSIVNNHTFDNGNKRTAFTVIQELMARNGISTGVGAEGIKDVIYKIATGELRDVSEIAKALRGF